MPLVSISGSAVAPVDLFGSAWAQEHRLLLDGLLSGVSYVVEEAASVALPLELAQGVARLGRLMAVHRHRNLLDSGSWLEAFVDGLQDSPSVEEIVEIVREAMAVEFSPGGNGAWGPGVGARGLAGGAQGPMGGARAQGVERREAASAWLGQFCVAYIGL
ncbi:hypothetical protein C0992_008301 [Termitomyces sp. T32_za158]|nr:hypothetical protein C0992_008301 [Termitomyces sp. T32_za158]